MLTYNVEKDQDFAFHEYLVLSWKFMQEIPSSEFTEYRSIQLFVTGTR